MKRIIFILFLLILYGCNPAGKPKGNGGTKKYTIEQFLKNTDYLTAGLSHDEKKLLVSSNQTGIYNVFEIPIDCSYQIQKTKSTGESIFAISFFPEDNRILYSADEGGNELDHIYLLNEDGSVKDLTPWEQAKSNFIGWARDNKSFFFISNKRDQRYFDLYETDLLSFEPKLVYPNDEGLDVTAVSADKRLLALSENISSSNNELYIFDTKTRKRTHISKHKGDAIFDAQFFDVGVQNLYYLTNDAGEFRYLVKYNIESGKKEKVWGTDWDIWYAIDSYSEKYRIISLNQDARTILMVVDLTTGDFVSLPDFGQSDIRAARVSKSENLFYLVVGSCVSPNDIYIYDVRTGQLKKLTNSLNPEIDPEHLVSGQVVRYRSFDGLTIPAIYFQPHSASASNLVPALIWVHGGPGGQSRLIYSALIQYLVNHDYAVLAVNNRGSEGYGKSFNKMDDRKHGDADLKDCIYGKNFLSSTGSVDMENIGIIGGSYGGFITMAALAFFPEEFEAGVNIFGVTNWIRTLRSIPPYWESFRKALYAEMGDPYTSDSVMLFNTSPLFHAQNVTKPLIVLQGKNDPRVLQVESDEIVEAVRRKGVSVEYVLFDDEGHGFVKKENEIEGYGKILEFLDKHLKRKPETNR
jgi:dipeptidyl aminopeptidase/acylaminoacyl peptidase